LRNERSSAPLPTNLVSRASFVNLSVFYKQFSFNPPPPHFYPSSPRSKPIILHLMALLPIHHRCRGEGRFLSNLPKYFINPCTSHLTPHFILPHPSISLLPLPHTQSKFLFHFLAYLFALVYYKLVKRTSRVTPLPYSSLLSFTTICTTSVMTSPMTPLP
jgi:hypothetical protein